MVRLHWMVTPVVTLVLAAAAAAQVPAAKPGERFMTVQEQNKPAQKCRILHSWREKDGTVAYQVQALDTGEMMSIVENGPIATPSPLRWRDRAVATRIYHWGRSSKAPTGVPAPPDEVVARTITDYRIEKTPDGEKRIPLATPNAAEAMAKRMPSQPGTPMARTAPPSKSPFVPAAQAMVPPAPKQGEQRWPTAYAGQKDIVVVSNPPADAKKTEVEQGTVVQSTEMTSAEQSTEKRGVFSRIFRKGNEPSDARKNVAKTTTSKPVVSAPAEAQRQPSDFRQSWGKVEPYTKGAMPPAETKKTINAPSLSPTAKTEKMPPAEDTVVKTPAVKTPATTDPAVKTPSVAVKPSEKTSPAMTADKKNTKETVAQAKVKEPAKGPIRRLFDPKKPASKPTETTSAKKSVDGIVEPNETKSNDKTADAKKNEDKSPLRKLLEPKKPAQKEVAKKDVPTPPGAGAVETTARKPNDDSAAEADAKKATPEEEKSPLRRFLDKKKAETAKKDKEKQESKPVVAESSKPNDWGSTGKETKSSAPWTKITAKAKVIPPAPELPRAKTKAEDDPLLHVKEYTKPSVTKSADVAKSDKTGKTSNAKHSTSSKHEAAETDEQKVPAKEDTNVAEQKLPDQVPETAPQLPPGSASVLAAGANYVPIPLPTVPDTYHPPMPPQALQLNRYVMPPPGDGGVPPAGYKNAFTRPGPQHPIPAETLPPEGSTNAFAQPGPEGPGTPPPPVPALAAYFPRSAAAGYHAPIQGTPVQLPAMLPPMPSQPLNMQPQHVPGVAYMPMQPRYMPANYYSYPEAGFNPALAPAGYQQHNAGYQPAPMPLQQNFANLELLMRMLRESDYPSQREWAADQLLVHSGGSSPQVVNALLLAAKEDPAPLVRAACIRCIAKMGVNTLPAVSQMQQLQGDSDPRVRDAAQDALKAMGATPTKSEGPMKPAE